MEKRTLKIAGAAAAGLIVTAAIATWLLTNKTPPPRGPVIKQSAYIPPPPVAAALSPVAFSDVTARTGIGFQHYNGQFVGDEGGDSRYIPETMGPGVVLFDYDGDGDLDVFVPNGCNFATQKNAPTATA